VLHVAAEHAAVEALRFGHALHVQQQMVETEQLERRLKSHA
jgi:hypothetical protein